MRELRRRHRDFVEEEKKSDDPLRVKPAQDAPLIDLAEHDRWCHDGVPSPCAPGMKGRPLLLIACASGITSCYLWYGAIQEKIFLLDNMENSEREGRWVRVECGCGLRTSKQFTNFRMSKPATSTGESRSRCSFWRQGHSPPSCWLWFGPSPGLC